MWKANVGEVKHVGYQWIFIRYGRAAAQLAAYKAPTQLTNSLFEFFELHSLRVQPFRLNRIGGVERPSRCKVIWPTHSVLTLVVSDILTQIDRHLFVSY